MHRRKGNINPKKVSENPCIHVGYCISDILEYHMYMRKIISFEKDVILYNKENKSYMR